MYIVNMEYNLNNLSGRLVQCMTSNFNSVLSVTEMGRVYCTVRLNLKKNGTAGFKSVSRRSWLLLQPTRFKLVKLEPFLSTQPKCFLTIHVSCVRKIRVLRLLFKATNLHDWNVFIFIPVLSEGRADEVCKLSDNMMLSVSSVCSSTVSP